MNDVKISKIQINEEKELEKLTKVESNNQLNKFQNF